MAGYWGNELIRLELDYCGTNQTYCEKNETNVLRHFELCTSNPVYQGRFRGQGCLPPFQDPIKPQIVVGGCVVVSRVPACARG